MDNSGRLDAHDVLRRYADEALPDFFEIALTDVNQRGHSGDTPLCVACIRGSLEEVEALLQGGADKDMTGEMGFSPLHYAASQVDIAIVRRLLEAGANPETENLFGDTARDTAVLVGHIEIAELLDQWKPCSP